ncbi:unnamed protein product [Rotaria sp. Silwood1]|nr:unnamed protein product [Rotaria sp. Silwood1]
MNKTQANQQDSVSPTVKATLNCIYERICSEICRTKSVKPSTSHIFFIFDASDDLAKKKIYPTLSWLYRDGLLPERIRFIGYARSLITIEKIFENASKYMKIPEDERETYEKFAHINFHVVGS